MKKKRSVYVLQAVEGILWLSPSIFVFLFRFPHAHAHTRTLASFIAPHDAFAAQRDRARANACEAWFCGVCGLRSLRSVTRLLLVCYSFDEGMKIA